MSRLKDCLLGIAALSAWVFVLISVVFEMSSLIWAAVFEGQSELYVSALLLYTGAMVGLCSWGVQGAHRRLREASSRESH